MIEFKNKIKRTILKSNVWHQPLEFKGHLYFIAIEGMTSIDDFEKITLHKYNLEKGISSKKIDIPYNNSNLYTTNFRLYKDNNNIYISYAGHLLKTNLNLGKPSIYILSKEQFQTKHPPSVKFGQCYFNNNLVFSYLNRDGNNIIYAYNFETGKFIWEYNLNLRVRRFVGNSHSIFVSVSGRILCINSKTGEEAWNFLLNENIDNQAQKHKINSYLILEKNSIVFATNNGQVISLNAETGKENWSIQLDNLNAKSLKFDSHSKLFYILDPDNSYVTINESGKVITSVKMDFENFKRINSLGIITKFAITEHYIIASDISTGVIFFIDKFTGEILWHYNLNIDGSIANNNIPIVHNDSVYILDTHYEHRFGGTIHKLEFESNGS